MEKTSGSTKGKLYALGVFKWHPENPVCLAYHDNLHWFDNVVGTQTHFKTESTNFIKKVIPRTKGMQTVDDVYGKRHIYANTSADNVGVIAITDAEYPE